MVGLYSMSAEGDRKFYVTGSAIFWWIRERITVRNLAVFGAWGFIDYMKKADLANN
jgi:hypothetical protein